MSVRVKVLDGTLVVVLHNGEQEIERELAPPADALRIAIMMLGAPRAAGARRRAQGDGTELNDDGGRGLKKVREPQAPALLADRQNVSSCRRMRPIDAQR